MPRRSGTTTVWSFASWAASGDHISPVLPKPWISTTAGPWPPTRTLIVASPFTTCELRKSSGKGVGADETVADIIGSLVTAVAHQRPAGAPPSIGRTHPHRNPAAPRLS